MTITANMVSLSLSTAGPPGADALVSLLGVDAGIPASEGNQRVTLARSAGSGVPGTGERHRSPAESLAGMFDRTPLEDRVET